MAKKHAEVNPDVVTLMHAFLNTHAKPKLAAKLADAYPALRLEEKSEHAHALSDALEQSVRMLLETRGSLLGDELLSASGNVLEADAIGKESAKALKKAKRAEKRALETAPIAVEESIIPVDDDVVAVQETVAVDSPGPVLKKKKVQTERFQRVKSDKAVFLDDRLRDMSYGAKSGTGDYGSRANDDLSITRGKAFTKEKNKKKRGSYRGGAIDQGSHSIKFTYDDE
ncbi:jun-like transcription factor [Malassezia vespertilionis]|uniref:jun-like transcription factor n=1 Tax=Malassezia vespertilionis TaxID=2020962 RepID=UPI0024B1828C|nr:jun-like transcription factor [Malassezia vespertilionis]WFD07892.1 jun-like transcription factor [Malassezia vespertilionis]